MVVQAPTASEILTDRSHREPDAPPTARRCSCDHVGVLRHVVTRGKRLVKPMVDRHTSLIGSGIRVQTDSPVVILTFDDGPDPEGTPAVLDALREAGATATFFVLMTRVRRFGSMLAEVVAAGHEVALHGFDHRPLPDFRPGVVARRTQDARRELEDAIQAPIRWFRPPYGRQRPQDWFAVRRLGLVPILWSGTTWDSRRDVTDGDRLAQARRGFAAGTIMLCHDAFAGVLDGAADKAQPQIDRRLLVASMLTDMRGHDLSGQSLAVALTSGRLVRAARFSH